MNKRNKNSLGGRIYALRKKLNMTMADIGTLIGVTSSSIGLWEQGTVKPNSANLAALANLFDTSSEMLLYGRDIPAATKPRTIKPVKAVRTAEVKAAVIRPANGLEQVISVVQARRWSAAEAVALKAVIDMQITA